MVIADSSVWITFQRDPNSDAGRELDRLLAVDEVTMVGPVLVEVLQGSRSDEAFDFFASRLTALSYVETNQDTWVMAGELNLRLRRQGDMLSLGDLLISTLALKHDLTVYSLDGDFGRVPGLRLHEPGPA